MSGPAEKGRGFEFDLIGDLEFNPPEYVVDELFETDTLSMVFGEPASGKSFIALELALCVSTGRPFHGRRVMQGPVLLIAGEGRRGLRRRAEAWSKVRGVDLKGAPLLVSRLAAQFLDPASAREVKDAAHSLAMLHGKPVLIVIDTVARNFGAGDENNTSDMGKFVAALDALKAEFEGCSVLLVHHTGHGDKGRSRGSSGLKAALDCEYRVSKEGEVIEMACTKMKDAEHPRTMSFKLDTVDLEEGTTSAVLTPTETKRKEKALTDAQQLGVETFVKAAHAEKCWRGTEFAGLRLEAWRDEFYAGHTGDTLEAKKKAFQRIRTSLKGLGYVNVENDVYRPANAEMYLALGAIWEGGTSGT